MKRLIILLACVFSTAGLAAQIPDVPLNAIYFVRGEGGWDLYIKKLDGINSIILTESQRDPDYKVTAYSLRSLVQHPANAKEKRLLDGRPITIQDATCYLIDSTSEKIGTIGDYYHFFLTDEVVFGYSWARSGKMKIQAGVRINLRLFARKYGDYSGRFKDQWITLTPEPLPLAKAETKPKPTPEKAKVETTIVLLHASETEGETTTPVPKSETKSGAVSAVEQTVNKALSRPPVTTAHSWLVVDRLDKFPYQRIKDAQPAASAPLAPGEEKALCRYLFETDQAGNTANAGFATYHFDAQGRLIRVNEYGKNNQLVAVFLVTYPGGAEPVRITAYDKDGKAAAVK